MGKKVLSIIFFAGALLILIIHIANGTLFESLGSVAATYGNFAGKMIPIVLYIFSGFFLLTFDKPTKINYIDGFKKRSKQSTSFIVFIVAYVVIFMISCSALGASGTDNYFLSFLILAVIYAIPMFVFVILLQMYALPHWASKKYFVNSEAALNEYLSINETFYTYSQDNFVLSSSKALYFPQLMCLIPYDQISSVSYTKNLFENDVYINLSNGKKICIVTKQYDCIQEAINAKDQLQ